MIHLKRFAICLITILLLWGSNSTFPLEAITLKTITSLLKSNEVSAIEKFQDAWFNQSGFRGQPESAGFATTEAKKFRKRIENFEWNHKNYYCLGLLEECNAKIHGAIEALENSLLYKSRNISSHFALFRALLKNGQPNLARSRLSRALFFQPARYGALRKVLHHWKLDEHTPFLDSEYENYQKKNVESDLKQLENALLGNKTAEIKTYTRLIQKKVTNYPPMHKILGIHLYKKGDYQGALKHFKSALTHEKSLEIEIYSELIFLLAKTRINLNQCSKAITPLEKALKILPKNSDMRMLLGLSYYLTKQQDRAQIEFESVVNQSGKNELKARFSLALTLALKKKFGEAINHLDWIISENPREPAYQWSRMHIFILKKDFGAAQQAIKSLRMTLEGEKEIELGYHLAYCQMKRGDKQSLETAMRFQYDIFTFPPLRELLIKTWIQKGDWKAVVEGLEGFPTEKFETSDFIITSYGHMMLNELDQAISSIRTAKNFGKATPKMLAELGRLLVMGNEIEEAEAVLHPLVAKSSTPSKIVNLAKSYLDVIESGSQEALKKAIDISEWYEPVLLDPIPRLEEMLIKNSKIE